MSKISSCTMEAFVFVSWYIGYTFCSYQKELYCSENFKKQHAKVVAEETGSDSLLMSKKWRHDFQILKT